MGEIKVNRKMIDTGVRIRGCPLLVEIPESATIDEQVHVTKQVMELVTALVEGRLTITMFPNQGQPEQKEE